MSQIATKKRIGAEAVEEKGWLGAHKWLLLRRISQLSILGLFLLGPLAGIWIVKGNLSSSLTLGVLPLTDPFLVAQQLAAGQWPYQEALRDALGLRRAEYLKRIKKRMQQGLPPEKDFSQRIAR